MAGGRARVSEMAIARAVAAAVRGVPGVAGLSAGRFAVAATYGAGEAIQGVAVIRSGEGLVVAVHLRVVYADGLILPALAERVRAAVREILVALGTEPVARLDVAIDNLWSEEA